MNKDMFLNIIKAENVENANVIAYFYNKVCVGKYENNEMKFDQDVEFSLCNQIRFFNNDLEIRLIVKDGKILTKRIDDTQGIDFFDEYMFLRSDNLKRLVVRNYLNIDKNNQVMIEDSRLVGFTDKEEI